MSVDEGTVRRVAKLARLRLIEAEVAPLARELSGILAWVEQLGELDVSDVPPMTGVGASLKRRADQVTEGGLAEEVLRNAPHAEDGFFTVPKVVE
ncbi:MAG: Asp-tRNA(Asn)/Glu-tRNA(Gln) amidotransferase subunit GatC [Alphaproteobacteria bacterium]|nr:Asp-tRNA(Asn)/Glu-tRNA(Gln) amidotransferase subunit GatC [Alphaproteobacteria bacterium]